MVKARFVALLVLSMALNGIHGDRIRPSQPDAVSSLQGPKYTIDFHPSESPLLPTLDQESITMTDREGKKFRCHLPVPESTATLNKEETHQNASTAGAGMDDRSSRKSPENLLDALKDKCFRRYEGWWIYELCYKGHLRQFHLHDKKAPISTYGPDMQHGSVVYFFTLVKQPSSVPYDSRNHRKLIVQEFLLGTFDAEATAALHENSPNVSLQKDPRSQSAAQRYHAHVYTNGTVCDLTNQRRETEVRFACSETGRALINSVKEAPTCKYTVVFHAPMLCKHPNFQEERQPWVAIDCNAAPTEGAPATTEKAAGHPGGGLHHGTEMHNAANVPAVLNWAPPGVPPGFSPSVAEKPPGNPGGEAVIHPPHETESPGASATPPPSPPQETKPAEASPRLSLPQDVERLRDPFLASGDAPKSSEAADEKPNELEGSVGSPYDNVEDNEEVPMAPSDESKKVEEPPTPAEEGVRIEEPTGPAEEGPKAEEPAEEGPNAEPAATSEEGEETIEEPVAL